MGPAYSGARAWQLRHHTEWTGTDRRKSGSSCDVSALLCLCPTNRGAPGDSGIQTIENLKGKPIGVLSSSVAQRLLEQMGGADLKIYPGKAESLRDLRANRIE